MQKLLGFAATLLAVAMAVPPASAQGRGSGIPGQFDYYVLALSWSPGFCDTTGRDRGDRQCDPGRKLGFVTHGLWPQYDRGYPSDCGSGERFLPRPALDAAADIYPSPGLARHEWRQHGTCSGLGPSEYFAAVRAARGRVKVPDALNGLDHDSQTAPMTIERAFIDANPGLRADMVSVQCRKGALQEVRICLSKDLRSFQSCPDVDRRACRFGPISVTAPR